MENKINSALETILANKKLSLANLLDQVEKETKIIELIISKIESTFTTFVPNLFCKSRSPKTDETPKMTAARAL